MGRQSSRPARPSSPRVRGEPRTRPHRTRRVILAVVCAILIMVWVLPRPALTESGWVRTEEASGEIRAGRVAPVANMTCREFDGSEGVRFTWEPPADGVAPRGYLWLVEGSLDERGQERTGLLSSSEREIVFYARDFGRTRAAIWDRTGRFSLYTVGPGNWQSAAPRIGFINFQVYAPFHGLSMVDSYCWMQ